jgi:threonine/homoserine/homoserine lactone efflux protein
MQDWLISSMASVNLNINLFLAFVWFAVLVSTTPGPNCTVALLTSAKFGFRSVLPHMFGVMIGFASLLLACSMGAYAVLLSVPFAATVLKWAGIAYLIWMGWMLGSTKTTSAQKQSDNTTKRPSFIGSALFQFANPKAWLLATGAIAAYQPMATPFALCVAIMMVVCALACALGICLWAYAGSRMQNWLGHGNRGVIFNRVAGASLVVTALALI